MSDPPREFSDSDAEWYAALSGEASSTAPMSKARREGQAMRTALKDRLRAADRVADAATSDEMVKQQRERLQARLSAEGLFAGGTAPATTAAPTLGRVIEFPWWRRRPALMAMAASLFVAVGAGVIVATRPDYPPPNELMGADGIQRTTAARPRDAAEQLHRQLAAAGLRPGLYQRGRTYVVDVTLMAANLPSAAPAFSALGLQPTAGFNRVEIAPR